MGIEVLDTEAVVPVGHLRLRQSRPNPIGTGGLIT